MGEVDQFFRENLQQITIDSAATAAQAARELQEDIERQIRRNFNNPSEAFLKGVKVYEYENGAYVRLSPLLSVHAEPTKLQGNPNIWILLPDGKRLGFKRMGTSGFSWDFLKSRYGNKLRFVEVSSGHVVLFRSDLGVVPIYKIQNQVTTKQRIDLDGAAEKVAERYGADYSKTGRQVNYE